MRIPMTAKEQLLLAREQGHELSVETEASRADYAARDGGERYRLTCTCGWASNLSGTRAPARRWAATAGGRSNQTVASGWRRPEAPGTDCAAFRPSVF